MRVISAELFQEVDPQDFKIIIETHFSEFADRVRLISYVRPHAERLVSTYSEQVKIGLISTDMKGHFENLSKRRRLHFFPRFAAWRDTFGDRFTLRFFQRDHLLNGDVVEDFFDWMFRHSGTIIQADQISNSSLTAGQVTLIWRFFDLMEANGNLSQQGRMTEFVGRALAAQFRASGLGAESEPIMIPENLAKRIQSKLRRDARKVDATFFSGNPMADALRNIPKKIIGTNKGNDATAYYSNEMLEAFDAMSQMSISLFGEGAVQAQKRVKHLLETSSQEF